MNITLSKVHFVKSMSEETNCFDAIVCVDGVPAFYVKNEGHGGCNFYGPLKGQSREAFDAAFKKVEDYAKTVHTEFDFEQVDILLDELLNKIELSKTLARRLKAKMLVTVTGKKGVFAYKTPYSAEFAARVRAKDSAVDQILNEIPFDKALEIFSEK